MHPRSRRPWRVVAALLAATSLVVLAACGGDDSNGGDNGGGDGDGAAGTTVAPTTTKLEIDPGLCPVAALPGDGEPPVEIQFWHAMTERNQATLQQLVDAYHASQSAVRVALTYQGTYDETLDKYIAGLRARDLPNIVQMEETAMQIMLDSQSTVPVAACVAADDYDTSDLVAAVLSQYSVGGELVTWPFQLSNPVLFYNKAAFRRAGLDPERPPATLDEMLEQSRVIVSSGATPKAYSLQVQPWYSEQWTMMAGQPLVDNQNGRVGRAATAHLDSDAFGAVFAWIETLNTEGLIVNVGRDDALRDGLLAVANAQAAMTINTSASLGTIYDTLPLFPDIELGVAPMPGPAAGGVTVGGGSLYLTTAGTDAQKAAVWDLMKFLATPESQATWHIGTGYIPTSKRASELPGVQALWAERPGFKVAFDQLDTASEPPGGGFPVIGDYVGFRDAIATGIEQILNGTAAQQAQQSAQQRANEVLTAYNRRIGG